MCDLCDCSLHVRLCPQTTVQLVEMKMKEEVDRKEHCHTWLGATMQVSPKRAASLVAAVSTHMAAGPDLRNHDVGGHTTRRRLEVYMIVLLAAHNVPREVSLPTISMHCIVLF